MIGKLAPHFCIAANLQLIAFSKALGFVVFPPVLFSWVVRRMKNPLLALGQEACFGRCQSRVEASACGARLSHLITRWNLHGPLFLQSDDAKGRGRKGTWTKQCNNQWDRNAPASALLWLAAWGRGGQSQAREPPGSSKPLLFVCCHRVGLGYRQSGKTKQWASCRWRRGRGIGQG